MIGPAWLALDVQGTQSPDHRERGIARYIAEHAMAIDRRRPGAIDRFLVTARYTTAPAIDPLLGTGRVELSERARWTLGGGPGLFHMMSPFELSVPLEELWPHWVRSARLVVTLYDLIPLLFAERYLGDPLIRDRYEARLAVVKQADLVLAISESTRRDAIAHLGIDGDRVVAIGGGVSPQFAPPERPEQISSEIRDAFPGLRQGYVFYTGGADFRKNMPALIRAYGALPDELRARHQLVITCRLSGSEEDRMRRLAVRAGAADRVLLTNFVTDEQLVALYQGARLFVFPSVYEGYGLPIAEAMACGTPVIAADSSSLTELVADPGARFDPSDEESIRAKLAEVLGSPSHMARLRETSIRVAPSLTWDGVADRTLAALDGVLPLPSRRRPRKRAIALVTPYPPQMSGIAVYSAALAEELAATHEVHVFVDAPPHDLAVPRSDRVRLVRSSALASMHALMGYDHVLYCLGNSEFHASTPDLMRQVPGAVLAHDIRLTGLYGWRSRHGWPGDTRRVMAAQYSGRVPGRLLDLDWIPPDEAAANGVWLLGEVLARAEALLVHSRYARDVAVVEAQAAGLATPVVAVPFGFPPATSAATAPGGGPLIVSLGLVAPVKRPVDLVRALALVRGRHPGAELALVGPAGAEVSEAVAAAARDAGCPDAVRVVGEVSADEYGDWLRRAHVCVQLRAFTQGEASLTVAEAIAAGVPTVVTDAGWMGELGDDAVRKVPRGAPVQVIAETVSSLLDDPADRATLAAAGRAHAVSSSMRHAAASILEALARAATPCEPTRTGERGNPG